MNTKISNDHTNLKLENLPYEYRQFLQRINSLVGEHKINQKTAERITHEFTQWITGTLYRDFRQELLLLLKEQKNDELIDSFRVFIEFGTAGRRGVMGAGTNRINKITVAFTAFSHAKQILLKKEKKPSMVIGYDTRNNGRLFAETAASVYLAQGINVFLFEKPSPMPEVCFAIIHLKTSGGDEITASHNPSDYNGYKVLESLGAQLFPAERDVVLEIESQNTIGSIIYANQPLDYYRTNGQLILLGNKESVHKGTADFDIDTPYIKTLGDSIKQPRLITSYKNEFFVLYDPFYGSGAEKLPVALNQLGINFSVVEEHMKPDGNFPGINLPDPGEAANMEVAYRVAADMLARGIRVDLIIGTDPDADRSGAAIKIPEKFRCLYKGKEYYHLSANEMWALINWYDLEYMKNNGLLYAGKTFLGKSWVTTDLIKIMADDFNVDCIETGIGYEKLAKKTIERLSDKSIYDNALDPKGFASEDLYKLMQRYLISNNEESNGFNQGLEKDGSVASMRMIELQAYAISQGISIFELMLRMYRRFGFTVTANISTLYSGLSGMLEKDAFFKFLTSDELLSAAENNEVYINNTALHHPVFSKNNSTGESFDVKTKKGYNAALARGVRFHFGESVFNHLTRRPSGTEAKDRTYGQLYVSPRSIPASDEHLIQLYIESEKRIIELADNFIALCKKLQQQSCYK